MAAARLHSIPRTTLAPAEFAPYLQATGLIGPALRYTKLSQQVEQATVPLRVSVESVEDVPVSAGSFRAHEGTANIGLD